MARVYSNQTDTQEELSSWWAKNIVYEEALGSYDEILDVGIGTGKSNGIEKISDLILRLPLVKFYYYMVRFLVQKHSEDLGLKTEEQMSQWADRAVSALNDGNMADGSVESLAKLAFEDAISNGYGFLKQDALTGESRYYVWVSLDRKVSAEFDKFKMLAFAEGFRNKQDFFPIALALNMTYGETEAFLKKALHRETFNVWDENEMLLSLAFSSSTAAKWDLFDELRREYELAPIRKSDIFKENGELLTKTVRNKAKLLKESLLKEGVEIRPTDPNVRDFLSVYKGLLAEKGDYRRTRIRVCEEKLKTVEKYCKEDKGEWREHIKDACAETTLVVCYGLGSSIEIPKYTQFTDTYGDTYTVMENVSGPAEETADIVVKVQCKTPKTEPLYQGSKAGHEFGAFSEKRRFLCELDAVLFASNKSKFKAGPKRDYVEGNLFVKTGCDIPQNTVFFLEYKKPKRTIEYKATKYVAARSKVEVPVKRKSSDFKVRTGVKIVSVDNPVLEKQIRGYERLKLRDGTSSFLKYIFQSQGGLKETSTGDFGTDPEFRDKLREILKMGKITPSNISNMKNNKRDTEISRERVLTAIFLAEAARLELSNREKEKERQTKHKDYLEKVEKRWEFRKRAWDELAEEAKAYMRKYWGKERRRSITLKQIEELPESIETEPLKRALHEYNEQKKAYDALIDAERKNVRGRQEHYEQLVDETMEKCGMTGYYAGNPYDLLLKYLITTAEPFTTFRNLWSFVSCLPERRAEK